jgi:hypothetical protein
VGVERGERAAQAPVGVARIAVQGPVQQRVRPGEARQPARDAPPERGDPVQPDRLASARAGDGEAR